jgi:DNA-directed RNA polymerase specialized sigma24 family protein
MTTSVRSRILPIEHLNSEWTTLGRSAVGVRALRSLAEADETVRRLVEGDALTGDEPHLTPHDLIEHMRQASGRQRREEAAFLIRVMLQHANVDPLISRFILQAILPGMVTVAGKLQWGRGGDWDDANEFFGELLSTAWEVVTDWSGEDRPYAVLDLLSAIRCRMRRQLMRAKHQRQQFDRLTPEIMAHKTSPSESDLELLARRLIELQQEGMRPDEVGVLYAQHVLGYSISELAAVTGRDRRGLYARRDRGQRRLCA